jgi:hypothetical protein
MKSNNSLKVSSHVDRSGLHHTPFFKTGRRGSFSQVYGKSNGISIFSGAFYTLDMDL